ncbi:MAG: DUF4911 domain-containing protein [Synergistetes bacterium]|nr:DUF4911 domain-containing protein [Synergistota bacterium]
MSERKLNICVKPDRDLVNRKFRLNYRDIYYVSSIFQCYPEIGEIRTLDPREGKIVLNTTPSCLLICMKVIEGLRKEGIDIEEIDE